MHVQHNTTKLLITRCLPIGISWVHIACSISDYYLHVSSQFAHCNAVEQELQCALLCLILPVRAHVDSVYLLTFTGIQPGAALILLLSESHATFGEVSVLNNLSSWHTTGFGLDGHAVATQNQLASAAAIVK